MKLRGLILFCIVFLFACKAKVLTEDDLKSAMQTFLYNAVNNDSSKVKYNVEKVSYYDDKQRDKYVCVFTVHMKANIVEAGKPGLLDTTGTMKAYISRDLKKIDRFY